MYGEYGCLIRGNMRFQGTGELTVSYALQAPEYRLLRERYPDAGWEIEAPCKRRFLCCRGSTGSFVTPGTTTTRTRRTP